MKIDVSCAWGEGPDIAMNLLPSKKEQEGIKRFNDGLIPVDFTIKEAKELANKLLMSAMQAESLKQSAIDYFEEEEKDDSKR